MWKKNKVCSICGEAYPADNRYFPPHPRTLDLLRSYCWECYRQEYRDLSFEDICLGITARPRKEKSE